MAWMEVWRTKNLDSGRIKSPKKMKYFGLRVDPNQGTKSERHATVSLLLSNVNMSLLEKFFFWQMQR